ncbi:MAG: undecaprenyl-phosphate glucose phosphotransferase [Spartobacteria bacterium]|nr:undecaprenyl-phosphate glucose phosphotransferase [Spartobacteria bacterium]
MRITDTFDVVTSATAAVADALAIFCGFLVAIWIRFDSGWIPMFHDGYPSRVLYLYGSGVATLLFLFIFRSLNLYVRPQLGTFVDSIPRLVRANTWGIFLAVALAFIIRTDPPFSRIVVFISFFTVLTFLLIERYILFRLEIHAAKNQELSKRVLVIGTDSVAAHLRHALENEPRLRSTVVGFLRTASGSDDAAVPGALISGTVEALDRLIQEKAMDHIILADTSLRHERMVDIIVQCERSLITFHLVPDIFRVLTSGVEIQSVDGIPLLGVSRWPLDIFWNRIMKRAEDILGAAIGLAVSIPVLIPAACLIKRESPGPVLYRQTRCGKSGEPFTIYKLRTMRTDAESETGPVWASEGDQRRTRIGAFLRRHNLDEMPQFWNVLKGEMSLVGPRPERPHFVEQFKEDISRYMWRHVSKPGMTGWAQVNGLRGNTSIQERIKYDLYYLENWSLSFDFKIIIRTFFTRKNAY